MNLIVPYADFIQWILLIRLVNKNLVKSISLTPVMTAPEPYDTNSKEKNRQ